MALALGDTIDSLQRRMTRREFENWMTYYRAWPFDDRHRYHRPAARIAVALGGGSTDDVIDWLQPEPKRAGLSEVDKSLLKAFLGSK